MLRRWDLLLIVALALVAIGSYGVDWRLGLVVAGLELGNVWYWLSDTREG